MSEGGINQGDSDAVTPSHGPEVLKVEKPLVSSGNGGMPRRQALVELLRREHQHHPDGVD